MLRSRQCGAIVASMNELAPGATTGTTTKRIISMSMTGIEIMRLPAVPGGG